MPPVHTLGNRRRRRIQIGDRKKLTEIKNNDFFTRLKPTREQKDDKRHPIPPTKNTPVHDGQIYNDPIVDFVMKVSEKV